MYELILGIIIVSFIIGFVLSFSIGANDVANAFGTSFGSGALNFHQVCILATIFEVSGAVLLGGGVADTISKGIANMEPYNSDISKLYYGYLCALFGASIWLLLATFLKLPVSGTHSIVGSVLGFTLVAHGVTSVRWMTLLKVVSSWFTSPILSGLISFVIYFSTKHLVLKKSNQMQAACRFIPVLFGIVCALNSYMTLSETFKLFELTILPQWALGLIGLGLGCICALVILIFVMPIIRKKVIGSSGSGSSSPEDKENKLKTDFNTPVGETTIIEPGHCLFAEESPEICKLFSYVQVVTACCSAFSHGGNDVSNAIGPILGCWRIFQTGQSVTKDSPDWWILLYGGGKTFFCSLPSKRTHSESGAF